MDKPVHLPTFNDRVHSGQDAFRLGRDANLDIKITHGNLAYNIQSRYERCHYMYFLRDASSLKLVRYNQIYEMFVPSSILHKCLDFGEGSSMYSPLLNSLLVTCVIPMSCKILMLRCSFLNLYDTHLVFILFRIVVCLDSTLE